MELLAATALSGVLLASSAVVLRSTYAVWSARDADSEAAQAAHAVLRHLVRSIRQAEGVTDLSGTLASGKLTLLMPSAVTRTYAHDTLLKQVYYGLNTATPTNLLAEGIDEFSIQAYKADGVTLTTSTSEAHLLRCTVKVTMPRGAGQQRTVSCLGWIRSW